MSRSTHSRPSGVRPALAAVAASLPLALLLLVVGACASSPAADPAPEAEASPEAQAEPAPAQAAAPAPNMPPLPEPQPVPKSMADALTEVYADAIKGEGQGRPSALDPPEPPDGQWEVDEEGRKYFVRAIPKVEGAYRRVGEDQVRMRHGITLTLVGETENEFLYKIYQVSPVEQEDDTPTPEEIAEVEASYQAQIESAELLSATDFGAGLPKQGQWRNGFDVGDANGDGHLDIVHGPPRRGFSGPVVLLGDGAGNWTPWSDASYPELPYDYGDTEAADFDGDGHLDMALAIHLSGMTVLRGDGAGKFGPWGKGLKLVPPGQADNRTFLSRAMASIDWDGDGLTDLVALSEGPRHPKAVQRSEVETPLGVIVYRNQGDGSWAEHIRLSSDAELFGDTITVGDFDGDGRDDVATGSNALGRRQVVFLNRGESVEPVEVAEIRPLAFVWAIEAADFDGDGRDDLVLANSSLQVGDRWAGVDLLLSREAEDGSLRFERRVLLGGREEPDARITALGTGDLDGDGATDLVAVDDSGGVHLFVGAGRGGLTRDTTTLGQPTEGCRGYQVRVADFNDDGSDEAVVALAGESCPGGGRLEAWKIARN
jgi:hypothetical protein